MMALRRWITQHAEPLVLTAAFALLIIPATYAGLRGYDVLFRDEPHPSTVGPSAHIAMFWRVNLGTALGLASAPLVFRLACAAPGGLWRVLPHAAVGVATLAFLQGFFLP
jgi:hypothetical protein